MTDFAVELRHRCRNPLCRCKLPEPVANKREAFCTRGCYGSFYLHRCRVCEEPIEQPKHGTRLICKKSKCQNEWKTGLGFGRFAEFGSGIDKFQSCSRSARKWLGFRRVKGAVASGRRSAAFTIAVPLCNARRLRAG